MLNTLEREKGKMTTVLDQLKSMKSDKACLEELVILYIVILNNWNKLKLLLIYKLLHYICTYIFYKNDFFIYLVKKIRNWSCRRTKCN